MFGPDDGQGTSVNLYTASHQIRFFTVVAVAVSDPTIKSSVTLVTYLVVYVPEMNSGDYFKLAMFWGMCC
jgi:hypothetical protein